MRLRYYPVGVGVFVSVGVLALFAVRSGSNAEVVGSETDPDRAVQLELLRGDGPPPEEAQDRFAQVSRDAGEGARAKREQGRVGKKDSQTRRAKGNRVAAQNRALDKQLAENSGVLGALRDAGDLDGMFGSSGLDANLSGGVGGLIGTKATQIGSGDLGSRGAGRGGGGISGYGSGSGGFGARGSGANVVWSGSSAQAAWQPPVASLSKDLVDYGHNPTELVERDMLSTFSIDVDTASYTQARTTLQHGALPPSAAVRTEEFVNYFRYDYPEPERGRPFSVTLDAAEHPWAMGHHILRVGIKGAEEHDRARRPVHLTFLVDVSGSMYHPMKLDLAKQSLVHLVDNLQEGDTVALVTYAGQTRVALPTMDASNRADIVAAIRGLSTGGGTAMSSGMDLAYELAAEARRPGEESRVIVLSDGDANIGAASHESILRRISRYAGQGITLSTVGFGSGNYRDALMEQLADKGDGNYSYVDDFDEAKRIFGEDMGATLRTIARDVKIQVAFDPDSVIAYTLIGYENRDIADEDFRDDKVDAGEVGAGHTVTALYDVILRDRPGPRLAEVRVRHKEPGPDVPATETSVDLSSRAVDIAFEAGSRDLRRAFGTAAFAEKLRGADWLEEVTWDQIVTTVEQAARVGDDRDQELKQLARTARGLATANASIAANGGQVQAASPIILGALDKSLIDRVIRRHFNQVRYCYQRELVKNPTLSGDLTVKFVIGKSGSVSNSQIKTSNLGNRSVEQCVAGRFMRMQFPPPTGGGIVIASYPFQFTPA